MKQGQMADWLLFLGDGIDRGISLRRLVNMSQRLYPKWQGMFDEIDQAMLPRRWALGFRSILTTNYAWQNAMVSWRKRFTRWASSWHCKQSNGPVYGRSCSTR